MKYKPNKILKFKQKIKEHSRTSFYPNLDTKMISTKYNELLNFTGEKKIFIITF